MYKKIQILISLFVSLVVGFSLLSVLVTDNCLDKGGVVHSAWMVCELEADRYLNWVQIAGVIPIAICLVVMLLAFFVSQRLFRAAMRDVSDDKDAP